MNPSKSLFISGGSNLKSGDADYDYFANISKQEIRSRWDTTEGIAIKQKILDSQFDKGKLEKIVGKFDGQLDLRGIDLSSRNISQKDLSKIDFFAASFYKTNLTGTDLSGSYLSESNIKSARFDWTKMNQSLLDNVDFDLETSFIGVNLNEINFTLAVLLQDMAITQQRIVHLEKRSPKFACFLKITTDYGRSLSRWSAWCVGTIAFFALLYWIIPHATTKQSLLDSIYFSIVTFTTLGYGDILPQNTLGHILVISEVCLGYIMGGLLIAILTKKIMG